jgi:hypothetical protein
LIKRKNANVVAIGEVRVGCGLTKSKVRDRIDRLQLGRVTANFLKLSLY